MLVKIILLFFVFSFLFRTDSSFDQDLGRHLKLGEIIIQTHQIPKVNLFSYTNPNFPFINTHWLFEVWVYWGSQLFGLQGLLICKVIIMLFSVWLILKIIPKENKALLLTVSFIFLHVLRERLELRPEIFSFLFTASTYFVLERFTQMSFSRGGFVTKLIWLLPVIQLIWVNTHIYFFVGLILQAIYITYIIITSLLSHSKSGSLKLLVITFILSVLVSFINPKGLQGFLYPLNVSKNYGYTIVENQTLFLLESIHFKDPNFIFVKLCWGIIILSLIVSLIKKKFEVKNISLSIFGLALSLINVRSFPYLFFLSMPATLQNFGTLRSNFTFKLLTIIFSIILIWESFYYLSGEYYKARDDTHQVGLKMVESVKGAMDFVQSHGLPSPIFNNFDVGSYIIYITYPKHQVFVDGRPEAYPKDFFANTYIPMQSDFSKFKQQEQKWGFKTIIFSHTDQTPWGRNFLQSIVKDSSWEIVYFDDFMLVLIKEDGTNQKELKEIKLSEVSPDSFKFDNHVSYLRMGYFLLTTQNIQAGKRFFERAYQIYPKSPTVNSILNSLGFL